MTTDMRDWQDNYNKSLADGPEPGSPAALRAEIERLTKERDLALSNADAVYARLMPENGRLRGALYQIAKDDEQEGHPCGPKEFGHFGRIALEALNQQSTLTEK